MAQLDCDDSGL